MNDLLQAVLADPHSDARGVLADHWAESPHMIPTLDLPKGVEVVWQDGLPEEVRCTMVQWVGIECVQCDGEGRHMRDNSNGQTWVRDCFTCTGKGRVGGIAKAVCEAWPVTRVVLVDREPIIDGAAYWYENEHSRHSSSVPKALFDCNRIEMCKLHGSTKQALSALSHAALTYGRRLAGLPELKQG